MSQNQEELVPNVVRIVDIEGHCAISRKNESTGQWHYLWKGEIEEVWCFLTSTPNLDLFSLEAGSRHYVDTDALNEYTVVFIYDDRCAGYRYMVTVRDCCFPPGSANTYWLEHEPCLFANLGEAIGEAMGAINKGPSRRADHAAHRASLKAERTRSWVNRFCDWALRRALSK